MQLLAQASHSFAHAMHASMHACRSCFGIFFTSSLVDRKLRLAVMSKVKRFFRARPQRVSIKANR